MIRSTRNHFTISASESRAAWVLKSKVLPVDDQ
jgi:hypothetical protein